MRLYTYPQDRAYGQKLGLKDRETNKIVYNSTKSEYTIIEWLARISNNIELWMARDGYTNPWHIYRVEKLAAPVKGKMYSMERFNDGEYTSVEMGDKGYPIRVVDKDGVSYIGADGKPCFPGHFRIGYAFADGLAIVCSGEPGNMRELAIRDDGSVAFDFTEEFRKLGGHICLSSRQFHDNIALAYKEDEDGYPSGKSYIIRQTDDGFRVVGFDAKYSDWETLPSLFAGRYLQLHRHSNDGGFAVVVDIETGEVLSDGTLTSLIGDDFEYSDIARARTNQSKAYVDKNYRVVYEERSGRTHEMLYMPIGRFGFSNDGEVLEL